MIHVQNLIFDYPGTRALHNISFTIKPQSITALVGPNGAGKTTLLRCLAALDPPMSGKVLVNGINIHDKPRECHRITGYLSDFFGLYEELSVYRCLLYAAAIRGIPRETRNEAVERAAASLQIQDRLEMKAGTLSRGLRQRLAIAQAIVHEPRILLLDEPASGLDPEARGSLAELFLSLRDKGMTLLVSSHILAELDDYSTDMLVLKKGRIIANEPIGAGKVTEFETLCLEAVENTPNLQQVLMEANGVHNLKISENEATFSFPADIRRQHLLLKELIGRGLTVHSFSRKHHNIQQAYLDTVKDVAEKSAKVE